MNNNTYVHKYLKNLISKDDVVVDMTLGNGNDTYFLSSISKKVYGFDISDLAISRSKERLKNINNVSLIHDSHLNFDLYIKEEVKLFIFNLGYLPNSQNESVTNSTITLETFKKAYDYLGNNGYIVITFYLGHPGGLDEYYLLDSYIQNNNLRVIDSYKAYNNLLEPITYIIKK